MEVSTWMPSHVFFCFPTLFPFWKFFAFCYILRWGQEGPSNFPVTICSLSFAKEEAKTEKVVASTTYLSVPCSQNSGAEAQVSQGGHQPRTHTHTGHPARTPKPLSSRSEIQPTDMHHCCTQHRHMHMEILLETPSSWSLEATFPLDGGHGSSSTGKIIGSRKVPIFSATWHLQWAGVKLCCTTKVIQNLINSETSGTAPKLGWFCSSLKYKSAPSYIFRKMGDLPYKLLSSPLSVFSTERS